MIIYLYIKQHSITGLKYFGRTKYWKKIFKYDGSGSYWQNHINKHGREFIQTLDIFGFDSQELCTEFALKFSKDNNIVESKEWANQIPEDGNHQGGFPKGCISLEIRAKISKARKGVKLSEEHKRQIALGHPGITTETRNKMTIGLKNYHTLNPNAHLGSNNPMYHRNHSQKSKSLMSQNRPKGKSNKKWFNNGIKETFGYIEDMPDGFKLGRLYSNPTKGKKIGPNGSIWITNGVLNSKIKDCNAIPPGYYKGRTNKRKLI